MSLLFLEGFDDYSAPADLSFTAANWSNCSLVTGRGANGKAAKIEADGSNPANLTFALPVSGNPVIIGFALQATGTLSNLDFVRIQFRQGSQALFSIVQASTAGLLFFDATSGPLTGSPATLHTTDLTTGLIGTASYKNFNSYIQVALTPGNPGTVVVKIDGVTVLNVTGTFAGKLRTIMANGGGHIGTFLADGDTFLVVQNDLGITPPFNFQIQNVNSTGVIGASEQITCSGKSGLGNCTWAIPTRATGSQTYAAPGTGLACSPCSAYGPTAAHFDGLDISVQTNGFSYQAAAAIDDLYIVDNSGAQNNTFLGDTRVISTAPTGDGAHHDFTPLSGSSHFAMVSESPIDGDTSYNSGTAAAQIDTYTFPAPTAATGVIRAVQIVAYAKSDSGGADTLAPVSRTASADHVGATSQPVPAVYGAVPLIFETDPSTGSAWTVAGIAAAELGLKRTA